MAFGRYDVCGRHLYVSLKTGFFVVTLSLQLRKKHMSYVITIQLKFSGWCVSLHTKMLTLVFGFL